MSVYYQNGKKNQDEKILSPVEAVWVETSALE